jgi:acetyl esterase/lipase
VSFSRDLDAFIPRRSAFHHLEPDVVYAHVDGEPLRFDHYRPLAVDGPAPVLVFAHGGSWARGDPSHAGPNAIRFAQMGIATISLSYRFAPRHRFPAQVEDVLRGLAYVRAHAAALGIDAARIALGGMSAGAHLVLLAHLAAAVPDLAAALPRELTTSGAGLSALVLQQGLYDLSRRVPYDDGTDPIADLLGPRVEDDAWVRTASPIHGAAAVSAPVLLIHGAADTTVRPRHSERLYRALVEAGRPAELLLLDGAEHAFQLAWESDANRRSNAAMEAFLARHLLGR